MAKANNLNKQIPKPRIVAFEVTRRCKLNCVHCRANADANFDSDLTTLQCKKIIKSVADYNRCVFIFTGGEPLERADIFELIGYADSLGLVTSVATSGYDLDEQKARHLKKLGVLTLSFSLDSDDAKIHNTFRRTEDAYERVMAAIENAKSAGLKFQINTTVTKLNIDKLPVLAELAEKAGAYCFNPFMLVPAGRGEDALGVAITPKEYEKALRIVADLKASRNIDVRFTCAPRFAAVFPEYYSDSKKKVYGCPAGNDFAFITHKGDLQTCGFLKISAGNILQTGSFAEIWERSDLLNSIRRKDFNGKCGACKYVRICGGCRARAFTMTGDCLGSDPLCAYKSQNISG
jgi:radical SAM protein with 4Fe4S-binding SPASM domain